MAGRSGSRCVLVSWRGSGCAIVVMMAVATTNNMILDCILKSVGCFRVFVLVGSLLGLPVI